uniref:Cytochrome c oxidase subunit 3 n=1 Tax=Cavernulicola chilensis TaxID=3028028 RepID=A0A7H0WB71_9RHOD|nr:cytochrome c oxidase subunit 3 [Cavernulicola chilensis]QNR39800.1 cytochrome c oxidase subunit 3 [Cavernulicola chilensis]
MTSPSRSIQRHPFHLVDPSPWPLMSSVSALLMTVGAVILFQGYREGGSTLTFGFAILTLSIYVWWRDVVRESTFEGHHTGIVQVGMRYGMILFISTEVIFFVAFFWAFFHSSLSPSVEMGSVWPPRGIYVFNPWEIPFLNTVILLLSGCTVTWAHHAIVAGNRTHATMSLVLTVFLASIFISLQALEYIEASFRLSDGVYGSTFYLATGFHGFHVFVGTLFLSVCLLRLLAYHLTRQHHFGFEAAAWYWHFVDVVWLFLFVSVYWWGGGGE